MSAPAPLPRLFDLRFLALLAAAAGLVHIVTSLRAVSDTTLSAYARLTPELPANVMKVLPPIRPGAQQLPFMSADARYAICHFDTAKGPVSVNAELPDHGWTIGIFHRDGSSAYFAAAPQGRVTKIALIIVPDDDRFLGLTPEARGKINAGAAPLAVTAKEGLVVVRAPDKGLAYAAESEAGLAKASCAPKTY